MKYNLSRIMLKAWEIYRKYNIKFSEALHRAWLSAKAEEVNAKRIEVSKKAFKRKGELEHEERRNNMVQEQNTQTGKGK